MPTINVTKPMKKRYHNTFFAPILTLDIIPKIITAAAIKTTAYGSEGQPVQNTINPFTPVATGTIILMPFII